ncbi:MAG TPA: PAS domain S-box protein [Burkholderiales bacterium]
MQDDGLLRRSQELLAKLFRNSPAAIALVRQPDGVVLDVNDAYERLFGWRREEAIGRSTAALRVWVDPEDRVRFQEQLLARGRVIDFESRARRKSGEVFDSLVSSEMIEEAGERIVLVIVVDVSERKRAEAALRQSEQRYRTLAATMVEGILILQEGRFAYANPGALELLGYSFEELKGREFVPFIHPEFREMVRERHRRRSAGEALEPRYDIQVLVRSGEPRWVQIANERVDWEGRPAVLTVISDITERKAAEQALRASEERFARLFREAPEAMTLVRAADGIYLDVNQEWERQTGFSRDAAIGGTSLDLGIWREPREREAMLRAMRGAGSVSGMEFALRRRDGTVRRILLNGTTVEIAAEPCWLFVLRDITERRRAEESLRESEQRFRALVDLSSDWYWVTDAEHRFTLREGEVLQRMGLDPGADYGKRRWEMGFLNMTEADWASHRALLERREEFRDLLLGRKSPDGRVHWATISGRPLYDAAGRFLGYHGTGRDVTQQVSAEERLRKFNVELERMVVERTAELAAANKELEAFTYSVSHDLRAPLRAIDGFSRILEERHAGVLGEEARDYLQRVRAAARRMGQLIEDLIAFSRLGRAALHRREVDLSALARLVAKELEASAPARRVEWRLAEGLTAHADPGLARVVLENLLGNAWKYSAKAPQAVIEFGRTAAGEFLVRDNGAGFDPAHSEGLFQPFRRLHAAEEFEGTGIGLATVKRIVERHGGSARAEGAPGAGATFYFTLPAREMPAASRARD